MSFADLILALVTQTAKSAGAVLLILLLAVSWVAIKELDSKRDDGAD